MQGLRIRVVLCTNLTKRQQTHLVVGEEDGDQGVPDSGEDRRWRAELHQAHADEKDDERDRSPVKRKGSSALSVMAAAGLAGPT